MISISISLLQFIAPKNVFEVESVIFITVRLANKLVFVLEHFIGSRGMVRSAVTIYHIYTNLHRKPLELRQDLQFFLCASQSRF